MVVQPKVSVVQDLAQPQINIMISTNKQMNNNNHHNTDSLNLELSKWQGNLQFNIQNQCWAILEVWREAWRKFQRKESRFYQVNRNINQTFKWWAAVEISLKNSL